jgi:hypothetical protein
MLVYMMAGVADELEGMWKEVAVAKTSYYPGIYLEGLGRVLSVVIYIGLEKARTVNVPNKIYRLSTRPNR